MALADPSWFGLAALDASVRLVQSVVDAGGLKAGEFARRLLDAVFDDTRTSPFDIFRSVPPAYWMVTADLDNTDAIEQHLVLRGAVLMRASGRRADRVDEAEDEAPPLSTELAAALREQPTRPLLSLIGLMREEAPSGPRHWSWRSRPLSRHC